MTRIPHTADSPIFDMPESPVDIMAAHLEIAPEAARDALKAIITAGWVIAPREPSNAMLVAYMAAYGQTATTLETIVRNVGKAKKRWQAMGESGTGMALTRVQRYREKVVSQESLEQLKEAISAYNYRDG